MTLKSVTTSGKPGKEIVSELFDAGASAKTVAQAVRVFLSNQRQGNAKVKTRGEVDRTKKKWYRQKGTGGARHGARSANIFVGGGVSHGPTGLTDWTLRMSKPMKMAALKAALFTQAKDGNVMVVEGVEDLGAKTKEVVKMLANVGLSDAKTLIVTGETHENLIRASRNLEAVLCTRADRLNTFEIMNAHKVIMTPQAVALLEKRLGKKAGKVSETAAEPKKPAVKKEAKKVVKPEAKKKTVSKTKKADK